MAISKSTVTGGIAALGGGGAALTAGVVISNQNSETIKDKLKSDLLPTTDGFENEWKVLATKLKGSSEETNENIKKVKTDETTSTTGNNLKIWCQDQKEKTVTEELEDLVKKWCVYKVEDKLKTLGRNLNKTSDDAEWGNQVKELKAYDESSNELELDKELKKIREEKTNKNDNSGFEDLRTWCSKSYANGYQGTDNDFWKLIDRFCSKDSILYRLGGIELSEDLTEEWTKKVTVATSSSEDATLKTKLKDSKNTNKNKDLQKWCQEQYIKSYDKTEKWGENSTPAFNEVKKLCTLTIEEKLDQSDKDDKSLDADNFDSDTNLQNNWKKKAKELNEYEEGEGKTPLTKELKKIKKEKTNDGDTNKEDIKNWCKGIYGKGYKGSKDQLYKLAELFCRKSTN